MQAAMGEVDGVPAQRHQLGRPQAVPVRDQHHGGVAVAMAVLPGGSDQAGDLAIGQVLARADLGVAAPLGGPAIGNCPNNGGRRHQRQMRFCHGFSGLSRCDCPINELLRDTAQGENADFMDTTAISARRQNRPARKRRLNWQAFSTGGHNRSGRKILQCHNGGAAVEMSPIYARFFLRGLKKFRRASAHRHRVVDRFPRNRHRHLADSGDPERDARSADAEPASPVELIDIQGGQAGGYLPTHSQTRRAAVEVIGHP